MTPLNVPCGTCGRPVDSMKFDTVGVTRRIAPPEVTYYHPGCYDPWADVVPSTRLQESINRLEGYGAGPRSCLPSLGEVCGSCHRCSDPDPVNSPSHYRWLPNGIEVIDITETLNFCLGNAVKYILRADHKGKPEEDLAKAAWYIQRELDRRARDNSDASE